MAFELIKSAWMKIPGPWQRFLKFGAPMITLIVAGSFGLKEFQDIKMDRRDRTARKLTAEEKLKFKNSREKPITIEEAYEEISNSIDINNWENKRGPRPWETPQQQDKNG